MRIDQDKVVRIRFRMYRLKSEGRAIPPQSGESSFLQGRQTLLPKVEAALAGLTVGDSINLTLAPADHFGEKNPQLIRRERREYFPAELAPGMLLEGQNPFTGAPLLFHVLAVDKEWVTVDGNHPLAGQPISFQAEVLSVREATAEELRRGVPLGD